MVINQSFFRKEKDVVNHTSGGMRGDGVHGSQPLEAMVLLKQGLDCFLGFGGVTVSGPSPMQLWAGLPKVLSNI